MENNYLTEFCLKLYKNKYFAIQFNNFPETDD